MFAAAPKKRGFARSRRITGFEDCVLAAKACDKIGRRMKESKLGVILVRPKISGGSTTVESQLLRFCVVVFI